MASRGSSRLSSGNPLVISRSEERRVAGAISDASSSASRRKRDPRLEARPRAIVGEALAFEVGHSANRQDGRGPCRGGSERAGPLRRRVQAREAPYLEPEPLPELLHTLRGRGPAPGLFLKLADREEEEVVVDGVAVIGVSGAK